MGTIFNMSVTSFKCHVSGNLRRDRPIRRRHCQTFGKNAVQMPVLRRLRSFCLECGCNVVSIGKNKVSVVASFGVFFPLFWFWVVRRLVG